MARELGNWRALAYRRRLVESCSLNPALMQRLAPARLEITFNTGFHVSRTASYGLSPGSSATPEEMVRRLSAIERINHRLHNRNRSVISARIRPRLQEMRRRNVPVRILPRLVHMRAEMRSQSSPSRKPQQTQDRQARCRSGLAFRITSQSTLPAFRSATSAFKSAV